MRSELWGESNIGQPNCDAVSQLGSDRFVGESPTFIKTINLLPQITQSEAIILIIGESGTGKELYARALHRLSKRAAKPFVPVNCGAIPDNLFENELFCHAMGAYTEATRSERGVMAEAEGGTMFLAEV